MSINPDDDVIYKCTTCGAYWRCRRRWVPPVCHGRLDQLIEPGQTLAQAAYKLGGWKAVEALEL